MRTPRSVETLKSLFYEARARLEHPVYGSAGHVYSLQRQIVKVNEHLFNAKKELASYIALKWDLSKIDRKEIDLFTTAATLHHQGIPTEIPLITNNGPTPDLRQQKQQDFEGEADLTLDHELDTMDHSSSD
ncbi:hypothetical protein NC652_018786 [Populus alba x Populus x berolinensis]|uniref:LOB domain-containing protein n=1 Tax=Populus tomentosa TaxID=118781 RepID=A0A8X7ZDW4_POPTO|nr:hypothetical protein POTOM_026956 [Populus tomentosa]KAJ6916200.1 hypothetical protein NC652_018786 [Populus alba x Populus x berolinensis]